MATTADGMSGYHRKVQERMLDAYATENGWNTRLIRRRNSSDFKACESYADLDENTKKKIEEKVGKYKKKQTPYTFENIFLLIASIAVFYLSDFYLALRYDPRVNRIWLSIGAILVGINISIALFLIGWLTLIKKVSSNEWERKYPAAIPIATAAFVIGSICVMIGLWPVWSIFTPVILFFIFMGFVVVVTMLPNF